MTSSSTEYEQGDQVNMRAFALLTVFALVSGASAPAHCELPTFTGFSPASAARQFELERQIDEAVSTQRIEDHLRWLTSQPHPPGSEATRKVVDYLHRELSSYGFDTETVEYVGYLPAPISVSHTGSSGLAAFHRTKSRASSFS